MRAAWLALALVCLVGCESSGPKRPTVERLSLQWTAPDGMDNGEALAPEEITLYRLTCHDVAGTLIDTKDLTRYVQGATLLVRPGTYTCQVAALARDAWSDPSNPVTQSLP